MQAQAHEDIVDPVHSSVPLSPGREHHPVPIVCTTVETYQNKVVILPVKPVLPPFERFRQLQTEQSYSRLLCSLQTYRLHSVLSPI